MFYEALNGCLHKCLILLLAIKFLTAITYYFLNSNKVLYFTSQFISMNLNAATEKQSSGLRIQRDRESLVRQSLSRARRISQLVTAIVTATFTLCWGPYSIVGFVFFFIDMEGMLQMVKLIFICRKLMLCSNAFLIWNSKVTSCTGKYVFQPVLMQIYGI